MFYQKAKETLYKALPVQLLEGSEGNATSLETQSNPSLQSQLTTSDESDTVRVYDFNRQETTVLKATTEIPEQAITSTTSTSTSTTSTTASMESALGTVPSDTNNTSSSSSSASIDASRKRERPVVLQFGPADTVPAVCASPTMSTSRGSTPPAFRFLQPKRRLIEPSQVLSIDEDEVVSRIAVFTRSNKSHFPPPLWQIEPSPSPVEKTPIEDEVAHSMPSVKALAQAFLLTSKRTQPERRWRAKVSKIYRSRLTLHILMPDDAAPQAGRTARYTRKAKYASVA